jgi:hypothetical protein
MFFAHESDGHIDTTVDPRDKVKFSLFGELSEWEAPLFSTRHLGPKSYLLLLSPSAF